MKAARLALVLALPLIACKGSTGSGAPAPIVLTPPAIDAAAGAEVINQCQSVTLNNDSPLWVNTVEMSAGPAWHHSNWFFVPDSKYAGADGTWSCASRGFDPVEAAAAGGVLFAQSTQSTSDTQAFPAGAAMRIPAHARIVGDIHLVNASASAVHTAITLTLDPIPESAVTAKLHALSMIYQDLSIPPNARSRFTGNCNTPTGYPLDFKIYYVLPHYHKFGARLTLEANGPKGNQPLFSGNAPIGEAWGRTIDPPIDVNGQTNLTFACEYDNTTDTPIHWGNAGGEMCVLLAYTDSQRPWVGAVFDGSAVVGTDGSGVVLNEGPCTLGNL